MSPPLRDAATVILLRDGAAGPSVLMGQRGARAAFMPSKFVFPGGAVEEGDAAVPFGAPLRAGMRNALSTESDRPPEALVAAALRELAEETGQRLSRPGDGCGWPGWAARRPDPSALSFVFRAVTPPGRPRRFDARFFLADAAALETDPDDFSHAEDELSHLHWVPLAEARALDVPFVTEVVLGEVVAHAEGRAAPGVPFLDNRGAGSRMARL
ncbi:NUDIX hydrolase [Jannaschia sp. Os4]|uniref:NUDIX hydrolase n=1 Tax=Jannaschia sp. Os4 TaxID=2807617 RepID=UPI0031B5671F